MSRLSRTKGASFERRVAGELHDRLGITFRRNLSQYQEGNLGDLTPDSDEFPFLIECKHCTRPAIPEWWRQTYAAALAAGKRPCLVYRITGKPIRVVVTARAVVECVTRGAWSGEDHLIEIDLDGLAYLAREGMAA